MPPRPMRHAALAAALATTLSGCASAPRLPVVEEGVTPRGALRYGMWFTEVETPVYAREGDRSHVAFTVPSRARLEALTGNVHRLAHGSVRFLWNGSVYDAEDREIKLWPLEEVALVRRLDETTWEAWSRGRPVTLVVGPECSGVEALPLQPPREEWWVHVRDRAGREGWMLADQAVLAMAGRPDH